MFAKGLSAFCGPSLFAAAALAATAAVALPSTAQANLITNGNFAANAAAYVSFPGYSASPNPADPTGWTGVNGVNGPDTGFYGGTTNNAPFAPAQDNVSSIVDFDFVQSSGNYLSQTVATVPSKNYVLTYYGAARANETSDVLKVIVTDALSGKQITTQTPSIVDTGWTPLTLSFTATSGSTAVEFLNDDGSNQVGGTVDVTNVVMAPVPEPAAMGLLAVGGAGLLLGARRCRVQL